MTSFIVTLIVIIILAIILYASDSGPTQKPKEAPSLKILPPRTGTDSSEIVPQISNFFNREEELSALESLFKERSCVTIHGNPGAGKTLLAAQFVKKLPRHQNAFWYTCDERTRLESLLNRLNGLLKEKNDYYFEPTLTDYRIGSQEKARLLARRLDGKNFLILIDQVERIKDERLKKALRYLGENFRFTKFILITSGETSEIHPDGGGLLEVSGFKTQEIEELLKSFGGDIKGENIEVLTEKVGSSPLELRLLDGLLSCYHYPIEDIMARINKGWVDLLNESLAMLREDEINLLRQLAAANEPLPEEGIKYLYRRMDLKDILSSLVAARLVTKEGAYYGLHPQIKDLLYPQLANKRETHKALVHYYLDIYRLKSFISFILEASHHSIMAGDFDLSISILLRESRQMIKGGYAPFVLEHLDAHERQKVSPKNWIRVAGLRGDACKAIGYLDEAKEAYEDMLRSARTVNSRQGMGMAYNNLGSLYQVQGDWNLAIDYYNRGLEVLKQMEAVRRRPTPQDVGWAYRGRGKWNEAIKYYLNYYEKNLKANQEKGDLVGQANSYANLGSAHQAQGDWNLAIDYYNRCLEILRQLDDPIAEAKCYDNLGSVYSAKGDLDRAITYYEKGLQIFDRLDEVAEDSRSLSGLGEVYREKEDYTKSVFYYERSLDKLREMGDVLGEARCLIRFANILKEKGDLDQAADCLTKSHQIYEQLEGKTSDPAFYETAAAVYQAEGNFTQTLDHLEKGLEISTKEGDVKDELNFSNSLGTLLMKQGRFDEAVGHLNRALEIAQALGDVDSHLQVYTNLSFLFKRKGEPQKTISYLERAKDLLEGAGRKEGLMEIYEELSNLCTQIGREEEANLYRTKRLAAVKTPA